MNKKAFINQHLTVPDPTTYGRVPFHLYPHQEQVLDFVDSASDTFLLHDRRVGITVLLLANAMVDAISHKGVYMLCYPNSNMARFAADEFIRMYMSIPNAGGTIVSSTNPNSQRREVILHNGSRIFFTSMYPSALTGMSLNMLVLENVDHMNVPDVEHVLLNGQAYDKLIMSGQHQPACCQPAMLQYMVVSAIPRPSVQSSSAQKLIEDYDRAMSIV